jgi:hypothetical protein
MKKRWIKLPLSLLLLCSLLFTTTRQARANSVPTQNQVIGLFVAVLAVGAAIGVGIYFAVRQPPSITGCARSTPTGIALVNEGDQKTYMLVGDTALLKTDERVKIKGKKKKDASGKPTFIVDKISKDFGACKLTPATP